MGVRVTRTELSAPPPIACVEFLSDIAPNTYGCGVEKQSSPDRYSFFHLDGGRRDRTHGGTADDVRKYARALLDMVDGDVPF